MMTNPRAQSNRPTHGLTPRTPVQRERTLSAHQKAVLDELCEALARDRPEVYFLEIEDVLTQSNISEHTLRTSGSQQTADRLHALVKEFWKTNAHE
ncbi:MAG: hypothetical protein JJE28_00935 [Actinomycetales bacterium]|nr:hypothetical protein [Actinomycetales bacterium]